MARRITTLVAPILAACAFGSAPAAAQTAPCAYGGGYPGDSAPKAQIAAWMASGAVAAGLPGELPVMGALVESGLQNLGYGNADSAGFFGMRVSIWDQGPYAGFPANPPLQLQWFVDQAIAANQRRVSAGLPPYGPDSNLWGEWVADVERPAAQYRGRYQLHLAEAGGLIAVGCAPPGTPIPVLPAQDPDAAAPPMRVAGKRVQDPLARSRIVLEVACPGEACVARARGTLAVPGAARVYRIRSSPQQIPRGGKAKLTLRLSAGLRRAVRRALRTRARLRARIVVTAEDAAGNAASARRVVALRSGRALRIRR
jgi:hypothetical protein